MHRYGGLRVPVAALALILFCMYVGLYHGMFGLLLALVAGTVGGAKVGVATVGGPRPAAWGASIRRVLVEAPFLWVAVERARTRITAFPWELLGYAQTGNFALTRIATFTGVYGLSFEIMLVNSVFAAAFLATKQRRKRLLVAACVAVLILQTGQWLAPPPVGGGHNRGFVGAGVTMV